jgi:dihydropteroate synthase-like protein
MHRPHYLFVTGKLAEPALRRVLVDLAPRAGFDYTVAVLPISVAALATTPWIATHMTLPVGIDRVLLPGLCAGDLNDLHLPAGVTVDRGPKDLLDLPDLFGGSTPLPQGKRGRGEGDHGPYDISILAEINHVPRMALDEILKAAKSYRDSGADIIDLGCDPGDEWTQTTQTVKALKSEGYRVSIDSFNSREVEAAVSAGAELVLSVNSSNCRQARSWDCEVVAIPDVPATLEGLDQTIETLQQDGVRFCIDPVIEPIGFGFAASLGRYLEIRRCYPKSEMLMGVGNITELTDVDSAGMNVMLMGFCQELGIRRVLTTEVINWSRSSVRELDLARRLVYHACHQGILPKHLELNLIMLRDPKLREHGPQFLMELAEHITDHNFRLFAEEGLLHVLNDKMHLEGGDPFDLFARVSEKEEIDPSHAFYLGYEMAKAVTALTLGKNYVQDQALNWGFLTRPEKSQRGTREENSK